MSGRHAQRDLPSPGSTHGHGHGHGGDVADVEVPRLARQVLLGGLVVALLATIAGFVWLWPDGGDFDKAAEDVQFAAPGVTFPSAEITDAQEACTSQANSETCGNVTVRVLDGASEGTTTTIPLPPEVSDSGLTTGDTLRLIRTPGAEGRDAGLSYFGTDRSAPVGWLLAIFVVVVLAVARLRGAMALLGLFFGGVVIWKFLLPALITGEPPTWVAVVAASAIMYVVLYTTHGFSIRTSAALAGTLGGIVLTAGLGAFAVQSARLTGASSEGGLILSSEVAGLSLQSLFTATIVVAGLGVLNDVTITQASAVWEIRAAGPGMTRRAVFTSGMRIGRDHIASTIYTIVFAYSGTALIVLMLLHLYDLPTLDLLATEEIGSEVVRTLATSIGLVLAVPLTTLIAVVTLPGPKARAQG